MLARGRVAISADPTEEQEIPGGQSGVLDLHSRCIVRLRGQLEGHGSPRLLLEHLGAGVHLVPVDHIAYTESHQVTATKLAVAGDIEQGEITHSSSDLQPDADLPDLPERERALLAVISTAFENSIC